MADVGVGALDAPSLLLNVVETGVGAWEAGAEEAGVCDSCCCGFCQLVSLTKSSYDAQSPSEIEVC